jgi:hypothetical protein
MTEPRRVGSLAEARCSRGIGAGCGALRWSNGRPTGQASFSVEKVRHFTGGISFTYFRSERDGLYGRWYNHSSVACQQSRQQLQARKEGIEERPGRREAKEERVTGGALVCEAGTFVLDKDRAVGDTAQNITNTGLLV